MMTRAFTVVFGVFFAVNGFSQTESIDSKIDKTKIPVGVDKSKPTVRRTEKSSKEFTISKKAGEDQVLHDNAYYTSQIVKINQNLSAINQKIQLIKNDEDQNAEAISSGWIDDMENIKTRLLSKKAAYQKKLN